VAVGDAVVYAAHGVGRVIARERTRGPGAECDSIVVELATGLRVTLSIEEATERLRPAAGKVEIEDVRRTLASRPSLRDGALTRRLTDKRPSSRVAGRSSSLGLSVTVALSTGPQADRAFPRTASRPKSFVSETLSSTPFRQAALQSRRCPFALGRSPTRPHEQP
jgi:hypothetical protein